MSEDSRDTGIPTRAIHESYLNLQESHREYRRARDDPSRATRPAHAAFQDAVLTFYELIRPHLKRKSGVSKFWGGELPEYPGQWFKSTQQAKRYYSQGIAIWDLQKHPNQYRLPSESAAAAPATDGGELLPADYHEMCNVPDTVRIIAVDPGEGSMFCRELRPVAGLKQLDSWETREVKHREQGDGFMASETSETTELRFVNVGKLTKAKRLLAEAADKMSLLSRVDIDHEDGAIVNFDQSRDGAEAEYRDAEYDSSPDI